MQRLFLLFVCLVSAGCVAPRPAGSATQPLSSESLALAVVYAGGGNAGASFDHDFVVVINRGAAAVSTDGLSLQYASASGSAALGAIESTRTPLPAALLGPGAALLVVGAGASVGASVPVGDAPDATPLALATTGGRLALVRGVEPLGCNGASAPCDAVATARVVDLVGWGSAAWFEQHAAPALTNTTALLRRDDGCLDTDDASRDLVTGAPELRTFADLPRVCGGGGLDAGVPADAGAQRPDAATQLHDAAPPSDLGAPTVDATASEAGTLAAGTKAADVQGRTHRSVIEGREVVGLQGVVTFVEGARFALQSDGDGDPETSDAVFVGTPGDAPVGVGLRVRVDGRVAEVRPGCAACTSGSADAPGLSVTTVSARSVVVLGTADLPPAIELAGGALPVSLGRFDTPVDLDRVARLDPSGSRIDRLETLEGMRVRMTAPRVVGPTHARSDHLRELVVTDVSTARLGPSSRLASPDDGIRLTVLDGASAPLPYLDVGDRLVDSAEGIVDYERGRFVLRLTRHHGGMHVASTVPPSSPPSVPRGGARIASFNVHALSGIDPQARFAELAEAVVGPLASPDLLALQEIGDDDGATDSGTTSATITLGRLVDAIRARGGMEYEAIAIDPVDGHDGGPPGLNIRPALLVRRGGALTPVRGMGRYAPSPSRLGEHEPALQGGRKPLVAELGFGDARVLVVVLHLRSQLGDPPEEGRLQPPSRPSDALRLAEAEVVAGAVASVGRGDPAARVIVLGDFNQPIERPAGTVLLGAGLVDAMAQLGDVARSTYVYQGLATGLDHVLVSASLAPDVVDARPVQAFASRALSASDHDPVLVTLAPLAARAGALPGCDAAPPRTEGPRASLVAAFVAALVLAARAYAPRRGAAARESIARGGRSLRRASRRCP